MKFAEICGQVEIRRHLQNAISLGKVSHAYIISGEKDSGKKMLAEAFAATLLCEEHGTDACGTCRSCRQMAEQVHPDVKYVTHEKPATISVDDIRLQINNDIVVKPYAGKYKIYIVDEAEKMNKAAQNALLKTIEEPPEYAVIFLLTTNASAFLQTILSRCITLELKPISNREIIRDLMEKYKVPDYQAEVCAAFAQGNYGKAVKLASSEEFNEMKNHMVNVVRKAEDMGLYEISMTVKTLEDEKQNIQDYLDLMNIWFRDVLLYKASADADNIIFRDEQMIIKRQSRTITYRGLENITEAIKTAKRRIAANGNFNLNLELMLLTIKENIS